MRIDARGKWIYTTHTSGRSRKQRRNFKFLSCVSAHTNFICTKFNYWYDSDFLFHSFSHSEFLRFILFFHDKIIIKYNLCDGNWQRCAGACVRYPHIRTTSDEWIYFEKLFRPKDGSMGRKTNGNEEVAGVRNRGTHRLHFHIKSHAKRPVKWFTYEVYTRYCNKMIKLKKEVVDWGECIVHDPPTHTLDCTPWTGELMHSLSKSVRCAITTQPHEHDHTHTHTHRSQYE